MRIKVYTKILLLTGLVAGTLDGLAAILIYYIRTGKDPLNVYRFVASGALGTRAFTGGVPVALLGILFHYLIALGWTIIFFLFASRFNALRKNWFIPGVSYGLLVWLIMNLIILPVSFVPVSPIPREWTGIFIDVGIIIFCVGIPVAFSASRYQKQPG